MFKPASFLFLPTVILLLVVSGCGDSPASISSQWRKPAVGSYYRFLAYESLDPDGNPVPDSTAVDVGIRTLRVIETGKSYRGVSGLVAVSDALWPLLLDYRSNGDLAVITENPDTAATDLTANEWLVLPVGSRGSLTQTPIHREFISYSNDTTRSITTRIATYAGSETMTVNGVSILVHRINVEQTTSTDGMVDPEESSDMSFWVAPSIGFIAKRIVNPEVAGNAHDVLSLIEYLVK